jgi:hypothetical protein
VVREELGMTLKWWHDCHPEPAEHREAVSKDHAARLRAVINHSLRSRGPSTPKTRLRVTEKCGVLLLTLLAGCACVHQVQFARLDGSRCEITHARAVWYSGAEWVDCIGKDGKAATIQTNHTDVGMMTGPGEALVGTAAMSSWAPLLITH